MSAIQKYRDRAQTLTSRVAELEAELAKVKENAAWWEALCLAPPVAFGVLDAVRQEVRPDLAPSKEAWEKAVGILNEKYPGRIP